MIQNMRLNKTRNKRTWRMVLFKWCCGSIWWVVGANDTPYDAVEKKKMLDARFAAVSRVFANQSQSQSQEFPTVVRRLEPELDEKHDSPSPQEHFSSSSSSASSSSSSSSSTLSPLSETFDEELERQDLEEAQLCSIEIVD